jgi:hypothetical protein
LVGQELAREVSNQTLFIPEVSSYYYIKNWYSSLFEYVLKNWIVSIFTKQITNDNVTVPCGYICYFISLHTSESVLFVIHPFENLSSLVLECHHCHRLRATNLNLCY